MTDKNNKSVLVTDKTPKSKLSSKDELIKLDSGLNFEKQSNIDEDDDNPDDILKMKVDLNDEDDIIKNNLNP